MRIQYIKHSEIDFKKWDDCISRSLNGIVYAYSWYLNIVAEKWDALVGDDYSIVFPLITAKKFGVSYIFQPVFTQQLGLFAPFILDKPTLKLFIESIPSQYQYLETNFNSFNSIDFPEGKVVEKVTCQLDLVQSYFAISSNYNENTRRNVSRSIAMGVYVNKGLPVEDFVDFKKKNLIASLSTDELNKLQRIISLSIEKGIGQVYAAYSAQHELCAVAFFVRSNGKVIYLSAASNELGKTNRAMFTLVDRFINDNSESHLILDFEGSTIESIARFYAGFGATRCTYQQLKINRLPWYLKPFKR